MSAHQAMCLIRTMARVLKVSASGYHAWRSRPASARATANVDLTRRIRTVHAGSHGTYGAPRVHAELKADGLQVGRKRIARLMRTAGIAGVSRRRSAPVTTRQARDHHPASDLVRRNFRAERPNALWAADITFLPTLAGFLYLGSFSTPGRAAAFSTDLRTRVIHHSDRGSQYTTVAFGNRCKEAGVRPSTGSVGDAYDNAICESFFATLECELIDRRRFRSRSEARMAVFQFIEGFYNPSRRHSALGYLSPIEYERKHDGLTKPA